MKVFDIKIITKKELPPDQILNLYKSNGWSSAEKPDQLVNGLMSSHKLVSAWDGDLLVGLGNTLSDGHLVVYYPHLSVLPEYHSKGIGKLIMKELQKGYEEFHQQILVSDLNAVKFYQSCGFKTAGNTIPLWIYQGNDHETEN